MNELHLFAGSGGGILGGILLGHTCVCAVEIEEYRRKVLLQRQRDGILPRFPVWDDVTTFDGRPWNGLVDVVCGGFPCQDISAAGRGTGIRGDRSGLWAEFARIIGEVQPGIVFVENSPMLTVRGIDIVLGDLAALGYDARWGVVSAADAIWSQSIARGHFPVLDHLRERIWIYATCADRKGQSERARLRAGIENGERWGRFGNGSGESTNGTLRGLAMRWRASREGRYPLRPDLQAEDGTITNGDGVGGEAGISGPNDGCEGHTAKPDDNCEGGGKPGKPSYDTKQTRLEGLGSDTGQSAQPESRDTGSSDADKSRIQQGRRDERAERERIRQSGEPIADGNGCMCDGGADEPGRRPEGRTAIGGNGWWESEPGLGRVASRVANRVDRLSAVGDCQVPAVVELAWNLLTEVGKPE